MMPVGKGQLESMVLQVYDVDVWDHLGESYGLEWGSLEEVLGNHNWVFLISRATEGRLTYGLDIQNLDLYICGTDWSTAYETTLTFWSRKQSVRLLILAASHNRAKYQQGGVLFQRKAMWMVFPVPGSILNSGLKLNGV